MAEEYVRTINSTATRFAKEVRSYTLPQKRGLINELAFLIAAESYLESISPYVLDIETIEESAAIALKHVASLRAYNRKIVTILDEDDIQEGRVLAGRLLYFLRRAFQGPLEFQPTFAGCGIVETCQGDVLVGKTLIEVKAGARNYRSIDLRQLLTYCALNFASKTRDISSICLVNPRRGLYIVKTIDEVCASMAGRSESVVLATIVDQLSEPSTRY